MNNKYSRERVEELEAQYIEKMENENPRGYKGRAINIARLHHLIELADNKLHIYWLSGQNAKMHKFLIFASTSPGMIRELVFDMVSTEKFNFGQATMGDKNCGAVTAERFEFQFGVEYHIVETIKNLTGQNVTLQ